MRWFIQDVELTTKANKVIQSWLKAMLKSIVNTKYLNYNNTNNNEMYLLLQTDRIIIC